MYQSKSVLGTNSSNSGSDAAVYTSTCTTEFVEVDSVYIVVPATLTAQVHAVTDALVAILYCCDTVSDILLLNTAVLQVVCVAFQDAIDQLAPTVHPVPKSNSGSVCIPVPVS